MKKLNLLFSLLLLSLIGATGAHAQWTIGIDPLEEITPGQQVVLSGAQRSGYMAGAVHSETVTPECLYVFEEAGALEGNTTYRLKQVSTGQYLKHVALSGWEDSSDIVGYQPPYVWYTANVDEAFTFTALKPNSTGDYRSQSDYTGEDAFVICSTYTYTDGEGATVPTYIGQLPEPFLSPWTDTNAWQLYEAVEQTGMEILQSYLNNLNGLEDSYVVGTAAGQVPQSVVDALKAAIAEAEALQEQNPSVEEAQAAIDKIEEAKAAADAAILPMQPGIYYIVDNRNPNFTAFDGGDRISITQGYTIPTNIEDVDAKYFWQVEAASDTSYTIRNYGTGSYVTKEYRLRNNSAAETYFVLGNTADAWMIPFQPAASGTFNVYSVEDKTVAWNTNRTNSINTIGQYGTLTDPGNCFHFIAVSQEVLDQLDERIAQDRLNNQLSQVLTKATAARAAGRAFKSDAPKTNDYAETGLIFEPEQLSSNAVCASEGSLAALIDGDVITYFHSEWVAANAPSEAHWLQVDLGEAYQTLALQYVERRGQHNVGSPKVVSFYTASSAEGPFELAQTATLTYDYPVTWEEGQELQNAVGIYNLELSAPARYIRMVVDETVKNGLVNGYPFWYLSEFHAYEAEYDPANSSYEQVSAAVRAELEAQLAAASAELSEGKATAETIAALQAAYDAFMAEYPDPVVLTSAIAEAKAAVASAEEGEMPGYYAAGSIEAFNTVVAEVEATVEGVMTLEAIRAGVAKLEAATAAFNKALVLPEVGKLYTISSMTSDANSKGLNSMIYAQNNAIASLKWGGYDFDNGVETVVPSMRIEYLWYIDSMNEDGSFTLRNVGTGFYMGVQNKLNSAVNLSATPCELTLRSARVAGGFNIVCGDGFYVNLQSGGSHNVVAWSSASGTDNSSWKFAEASISEFGMIERNVTVGRPQVLCLPYDIVPVFEGSEVYSVIGQNNDNLILGDLASEPVIEAGTPFVYIPSDDITDDMPEMFLLPGMSEIPANYAAEGKEVNGLVGVMSGTTLPAGYGIFTVAGIVLSADKANVGANSGYLNTNIPATTEAGDKVLALPEGGITAINAAEIVKNAPVDVYTIAGVKVRSNVLLSGATKNLPAGIYVVNGQKVLVK